MATPKIEQFAQKLDIEIEQGATFRVTLTWNDENGTPTDLTGWSARMQIREDIDDAATLHSMVSPTDITLGDAAGTIELLITATDTEAFTFETATYDLEMVNGTEVTRLVKGTVKLIKEVTR